MIQYNGVIEDAIDILLKELVFEFEKSSSWLLL